MSHMNGFACSIDGCCETQDGEHDTSAAQQVQESFEHSPE